MPANQKEGTFIGVINRMGCVNHRLTKSAQKQFKGYTITTFSHQIFYTLSYQSLQTLLVPSAEVLCYMKDILAANTADGTELLPELADVAIQDYTFRENLEP